MMSGYKHQLRDLKLTGLIELSEGKKHLKFEGYVMLCKKFITKKPNSGSNWNQCTFLWSFMTLQWSLMSRSDSIDSLMLQHFDWEIDSMIIEEQGHKGDQTGDNKYGKHVYANPLNPVICPILALAVYIFTTTNINRSKTNQLYPSSDNKSRFGNGLSEELNKLNNLEESQLGCSKHDIGTHSLRKGSGTFVSGQIGGPSTTSICLRMGHSIGQTRDKYIFSEPGSDQFLGRLLSGLPYQNVEFESLPPHFNQYGLTLLTDDYWQTILPGFNNYPSSFRRVLPYLLASLLYHENFIRDNLPPEHPLFCSPVYSSNNLRQELKQNIFIQQSCYNTGNIFYNNY